MVERLNEKAVKETHKELKDKGHTKMSFAQYEEKLVRRDEGRRKQEFEDRKIKMR